MSRDRGASAAHGHRERPTAPLPGRGAAGHCPISPLPGTPAAFAVLQRNMSHSIDPILDKSIAGDRLSPDEIQALFDDGGLLELGQAAAAVRRRKNPGDEASFIVDRNINYTNVCIYRCRFCAFYRTAKDEDAYVLPFAEIAAKVSETVAAGGTGILLQGGVHPELRMIVLRRPAVRSQADLSADPPPRLLGARNLVPRKT